MMHVDYLRVSITDRCNERCLYCLPEGFSDWKPREEILTYEEILAVVEVAVAMGVRKVRVTGGEPLVRKDAVLFVTELLRIPELREVSLSTNGTRLAPVAGALSTAGLRSVNVSLDAIDPVLYRRITGGDVAEVLAGLEAARAAGIPKIKLNAVLMRGINETQIWPLVEFAAAHRFILRFIELMPVSMTEVLNDENFFPIAEVKRVLAARTVLHPDPHRHGNGPAHYCHLPELDSIVGFIGAMSDLHFCESCNKMRLTADGKIRPCLGNHGEIDLKSALRPTIDPRSLQQRFLTALRDKPPEHTFRNHYQPGRIMTAIGG